MEKKSKYSHDVKVLKHSASFEAHYLGLDYLAASLKEPHRETTLLLFTLVKNYTDVNNVTSDLFCVTLNKTSLGRYIRILDTIPVYFVINKIKLKITFVLNY